jgi:hypothetical protein
MKFSLRLFPFFAMCCFVCLSAIPAHADPVWTFNGTVTMLGTDACGGQCVQTVDFSFSAAWQLATPDGCPADISPCYLLDTLPGGQATGSGPLGAAWNVGPGEMLTSLTTPGGDDFWLEFGGFYQTPAFSTSPDAAPPQLWGYQEGCGTETCVLDFMEGQAWLGPGYHYGYGDAGIGNGSSIQYTVKQTPEPGTLTLIVCGLLFVFGRGARRFLGHSGSAHPIEV